ncbi:16736_t:CDS:2 [Funneliformis caledonium]|uniref:16736_t:CDS:1 n=1 Tax=Funneliformis caledonium TaxID=1117310 RepID=A0A9N9DFK8_9GLOM|nr:16736_t:CDS:2 [Funneliformis caledonium]
MSATTSIQKSQQPQQKPGFRKIMTWNPKRSSKKTPNLSYNNASEGDDKSSPAPASPTPSLRSLKSGRPSLFATFARRNSTKSEHSSRSRSPTSPRPSHDLNFASDGIRTPSPTPSRNSMIFERDIEFHDHLSVHEAIDLAIPPVLDDAAEAFVNEEIPTILTETNGEHQEDNGDGKDGESGTGKQESIGEDPRVIPLVENEGRKRLSLINYAEIVDHQHTIAETLRVTTPREMNELTGIFDK